MAKRCPIWRTRSPINPEKRERVIRGGRGGGEEQLRSRAGAYYTREIFKEEDAPRAKLKISAKGQVRRAIGEKTAPTNETRLHEIHSRC